MFATIRRGASSDGYFAVPQEGSSFFIPPHLLVSWGLHEGQALDEAQFLHYQSLQKEWACHEKGLALLAMREHSRLELKTKLLQKGFSQDQVASAIEELTEEGALNERRYAQAFVDSRLRKNPEGRWLLARRLQEKGVGRQVCEEILARTYSDEAFIDDLVRRAAAKLGRRHDDFERIVFELKKKGFSSAEIRRALIDEN